MAKTVVINILDFNFIEKLTANILLNKWKRLKIL